MPIRIVARRWGLEKRSQVLLVFGVLWVGHGLGILATDAAPIPGFIHTYAPNWLSALAWFACGMYAASVGVIGTRRDAWAFTALTVMPMFRLLSFLLALLLWPADSLASGVAWSGIVVWATVVQILMILADWPNPLHPPRPE